MPLARVEPLPLGGVESLPESGLRALLEEARRRTLALVAPVSEEDLDRQHNELMSPVAWDLGHIAAFEDLWLSRAAPELAPLRGELWRVYDADETPRAGRGDLPYLRAREAMAYLAEVEERARRLLDAGGGDGLLADGYVFRLVLEHEHQHNETIVQALKLAPAGTYRPERAPLPAAPASAAAASRVRVEGGPFAMGAGPAGFAYDNERPRQELDVAAFELDRTPVTNAAYLEFVADGGYRRPEWWSEEGWAWRERAGVERPLYWTADGRARSFDRTEAIDPAEPVVHVSWYEADAFARSRGLRLPTEAEWEKAAAWDPAAGRARRYPWGEAPPDRSRANLDVAGFGPAPAGAHPDGASAYGALGLVGDAWEWTASDFGPYPGFRAFPYREYSEAFFGRGYKVLRGGSWATRPTLARATFRNWDLPERRQIFAGFRCAVDA